MTVQVLNSLSPLLIYNAVRSQIYINLSAFSVAILLFVYACYYPRRALVVCIVKKD